MVKETRLQEYAMLEKHILEAKARALALEDRETMRRNQICADPDLYGVPTGSTSITLFNFYIFKIKFSLLLLFSQIIF